MDQTAEEV